MPKHYMMSWLQVYVLTKFRQTRNGVLWEKKEEVCLDEEKEEHGDQWDHVVMDAESKAVISMVIGKRTKENTERVDVWYQLIQSKCMGHMMI
jgi:hypothetical protein